MQLPIFIKPPFQSEGWSSRILISTLINLSIAFTAIFLVCTVNKSHKTYHIIPASLLNISSLQGGAKSEPQTPEKQTKQSNRNKNISESKSVKSQSKQTQKETPFEGEGNASQTIPTISATELGNVSINPQYPARAVELGWQGQVVLSIRIINNTKQEIILQKSSGHKILDEAAIKAIKEWAIPQNIATKEYWVNIPIEFKINQS